MASILRDGNEKRELTHENEKCIGCGICSDICPTSALRLGPILPIARGLLKKDYITMNDKKCVFCGMCSSACPFDAMDLKINDASIKDLNNYPKWDQGTDINKDDCIYCGKCEISCPQDAIKIKRKLPSASELVKGEIRTFDDKCINCNFCTDICPVDAITIKTNINNEFDPVAIEIDESKCVHCKMCQKICPEDAIQIICSSCMDIEEIPEVVLDGDIVLDNNICVNCSWCENVCPTDAAKTSKPFEGEVILTELEDKVCKGEQCNACVDVCPCNAITLIDNKPSINMDVCVLCGACQKSCPLKILSVNRTSMTLKNINSKAWNNVLGKIISK
ncbi:tungsten-dependent formylmethanofuran dehydrogenase subunit FwdF [Methanobrevibacter sp. DSM 116169]|uniref:tungsten-dependent formylmethanofuran dehydrogenase subunit FwdF n=1 Tax=Methanobrevibacter sp. DSM 116169 TaxID=3242727 RepID=UPI0038FBEB0F